MDKSLIETAKNGDVEKLRNLIKDDPFVLRATSLADGDNPLHMSCIGGHFDFAKQVSSLNPGFAQELNRDGLSPLHIASASGDIEIVYELLKLGSYDLCLVKGKEKRIPLHCAVVKGRVNVVRALLSFCPDSVKQATARGESCFHLAVKNNQFEAFKVLCEHVVSTENERGLNEKDEQGNTILHLAASRKQYEVVDLLLDEDFSRKVDLEVNTTNKKGLAPLDVLISEGDDTEIEEMLRLAGAVRIQQVNTLPQPITSLPQDSTEDEQRRRRPRSASKKLQDYFKYDMIKDSPGKARNTLLVIAVPHRDRDVSGRAEPPGGIWQDDFWSVNRSNTNNINNNETDASLDREPPFHTAGEAVMGTHKMVPYGLFLIFKSLGFFMSLHMVNFLTLGLPLQFELRVAFFALVITYDVCMVATSPGGGIEVFFVLLSIVMPVLMPLLTKVVRDFKKGARWRGLPEYEREGLRILP